MITVRLSPTGLQFCEEATMQVCGERYESLQQLENHWKLARPPSYSVVCV